MLVDCIVVFFLFNIPSLHTVIILNTNMHIKIIISTEYLLYLCNVMYQRYVATYLFNLIYILYFKIISFVEYIILFNFNFNLFIYTLHHSHLIHIRAQCSQSLRSVHFQQRERKNKVQQPTHQEEAR